MKRASILLAAAVVLVANAFALVHAWRNRSGPVNADITLTQRELSIALASTDLDDSGVALTLQWHQPQQYPLANNQMSWLNQQTLRELGFDTSLAPSDSKAYAFYTRQRARRVFVALEYDGPAWRKWIDDVEQEEKDRPQTVRGINLQGQRENASRLMAIDADKDAARLRARHPDRASVIVVPAVIRVFVRAPVRSSPDVPADPSQLVGNIQEIPSSIHVPFPFSNIVRKMRGQTAQYRVHLRYGAALEPWIVGVEATASPLP